MSGGRAFKTTWYNEMRHVSLQKPKLMTTTQMWRATILEYVWQYWLLTAVSTVAATDIHPQTVIRHSPARLSPAVHHTNIYMSFYGIYRGK